MRVLTIRHDKAHLGKQITKVDIIEKKIKKNEA